ncbi:MAG: ArgE/DapE family deacylase [bacterium]|nr:ArgE/DapE family deacylase [bacterium]
MPDATGAAGMSGADESRITRDLAALVAEPSITGDEFAIQDMVADLLADIGLQVERLVVPLSEVEHDPSFPGTEVERTKLPIVAGRLVGARPGSTLMLCGHVDVVPPGDPATWTTPAFEPEIRDGAMYGRGTCDMKGGLVAAIEAVRLVARDDLAGQVVLLAVPSEEDGGSGALAAIRAGYTADACIITEPSNMEVVVAHGGAITFTLGVPGKAAHASMRREGVSALDNLSYLVEALEADEAARNASETRPEMQAIGLPYPTIIGQVSGGNWASTVMDHVDANGRYGVMLDQDCDAAGDDLRAAISRAAAEHEFLADHPPAVTTWGGRFDSSAIDPDHALPISLQAAAANVGAHVPKAIGAPYGADMRLFINQGKTPTVMYGPGDVKVGHAADENVPIGEVVECADVLARWIRDWLA